MITLKEFKWLHELIGLTPRGGFKNIIVRFMIWTALFLSIILFSIFFALNINTNKYRAVAGMPAIFGHLLMITYYSELLIRRESFCSILDDLQNIVNEREKREESKNIYERAEQQTSFATKIIIGGSLSVPILSLSPFLLVAYYWCMGKYTLDKWVFFYAIWAPFEFNTTLRCALLVLSFAFELTCAMLVIAAVPSLLIGFMIYAKAFFVDIKSEFDEVDRICNRKSSQHENVELKALERCKNVVNLHRKVNRFLLSLGNVMNGLILDTIMFLAMSSCNSLFVIEKYDGDNLFFDVQMPIVAMFFSLAILAVVFYLGEKFHTNPMDLSNEIYQTNWYQYPRSVQFFMLRVLMRSQQPFYLSVYGIISLNLENFLGLLRRMYSAIMILHRVD